jgi:hypothetical protein
MLEQTGTGLHVFHKGDPLLSIGDMATIKRNHHGCLLSCPTRALHTIGMDIRYGKGARVPVATNIHSPLWTSLPVTPGSNGMHTKTAASIINALWSFFIDARRIPTRIRCNFDSSFVKGQVYSFLRRKGIQVGASPPNWQSQNGAVKRQWRTATSMAHALLVEARLPKCYWFWALRKAVIHVDLLPCKPPKGDSPSDFKAGEFLAFPLETMATTARVGSTTRAPPTTPSATPSSLTTPSELFYSIKPDYHTLFQWGCLGYYCRVCNSSGGRGQFDMHSSVGIVLGRSNHMNDMLFWDPVTQQMNISADYKLDPDSSISIQSPTVL